METLNIQCIEQQQVLITLTLTDTNGAPVDLTRYAVYAASVGAVDPYCRRAARLEWAAAINNECSAYIVTAPGHDIARAPWKYQICVKNRQLGLEWAVVTGRVELTPRACGTDGIAPASYTVACEATPSGLVNVTLDATVGSISTTLEQVKASAAAAAAAAQNAHADAEDSEAAATKASQAALAAAADARIASDKATAAEAAATAAPEACAPYVQQTQQAAAAALDASRTATTAAAGAQASADAAAQAQGYATRAEQAQAAAVQASADAATAATTATQQAEAATAQAESARLAATTATQQAEAAAASAVQADTSAHACAVYDQRVSANATRAETAQQAAAASETAAAAIATNAAASATAAAASATNAAASAQEFFDADLKRMVDLASITYGLLELSGVTDGAYLSEVNRDTGVPRIYVVASGSQKKADIVVSNSASYDPTVGRGWARVLYLPKVASMKAWDYPFAENKTNYLHAPALKSRSGYLVADNSYGTMILSPETKFEFLESCDSMFRGFRGSIVWAPGTTFGKLKDAGYLFTGTKMTTLPDTFTFSSLQYGYLMFHSCMLTNLPAAMELPSLNNGEGMFHGCGSLEIDDIVRVCMTINDLQALATPKTGRLGLPASCKHNGETINTQAYLNANHPDFLLTLNVRGWTVTFL